MPVRLLSSIQDIIAAQTFQAGAIPTRPTKEPGGSWNFILQFQPQSLEKEFTQETTQRKPQTGQRTAPRRTLTKWGCSDNAKQEDTISYGTSLTSPKGIRWMTIPASFSALLHFVWKVTAALQSCNNGRVVQKQCSASSRPPVWTILQGKCHHSKPIYYYLQDCIPKASHQQLTDIATACSPALHTFLQLFTCDCVTTNDLVSTTTT